MNTEVTNKNKGNKGRKGDDILMKDFEKLLVEKFREQEEKQKLLFKEHEQVVAQLISDNNKLLTKYST